jgi:Flp pilus assembly protein TadD
VLAPGEPQVLNNLGLSALTGDLDEAEQTLRQALASPKATFKMRQNLAMVLGLQGKGAEAKRVSSTGPAPKAGADSTALIDAAPQQDTWKELAENG